MTDDVIKRNYELLCSALSAKQIENEWVSEFSNLIGRNYKENVQNTSTSLYYNDYRELCREEPQINNIIPLEKLNEILDEMIRIVNSPGFYTCQKGAIGGGFSSGKSSFINSFMQTDDVRLAIGIRPVTAIPSYVMTGEKSSIKGVSPQQGLFDLPEGLYHGIDHSLVESMPFIKKVISYINVTTPLDEELFKHISLIDTPGYNPANIGTKADDLEIAKKALQNADFLIWLVGLDSNGTISDQDLDFIEKLDFGSSKPLYIVANKAELKTQTQLEDILESIQDALDLNGLSSEGISAYSSKLKEEITYKNCSIFDFIKKQNTLNSTLNEKWRKKIESAFSHYISNIVTECENAEAYYAKIHRTLMDAFKNNFIEGDGNSKLEKTLNDLKNFFKMTRSQDERIEAVKDLKDRFITCVNGFCKSQQIEITKKKRFCMGCGALLKDYKNVCDKCNLHESGEYKLCPKCNSRLPSDSKFCFECGEKLV
ncbi:Dynamin family protein [Succinivibrio dextrinosolvens]|uniref:dynamin family protein n=1 Tax=Succinivibrio dextrinosolvens TaxID=83771 RepID=UPI0008EE5312|nr:dynamin family protein [Succinivibrio dextrinosolvens]SFS76802.1 Dynamin family protein [Succinivibrio dextrinosolvens]